MSNVKTGFVFTTTDEMTKFRRVLEDIKTNTHVHNPHLQREQIAKLTDGLIAFLGGLRLGVPKVQAKGDEPEAAPTDMRTDDGDEDDAGSEQRAPASATINASAEDLKNPAVVAAIAALKRAGISADITTPKYPAPAQP